MKVYELTNANTTGNKIYITNILCFFPMSDKLTRVYYGHASDMYVSVTESPAQIKEMLSDV